MNSEVSKMRKSSLIFILISLVVVQACVIGCDEETRKSVLKDGSELKYAGEQSLEEAFSADKLTITSGIADVNLQGEPGSTLKLKIGYKEYKPGDAIVSIENGELKIKSKSGKAAMFTSISGTIPEQLNLALENGTGKILLSNLRDAAILNIESGTGDVEMHNVQIGNVEIENGTGRVSMTNCVLSTADIETGTGSINLNGSYIKAAEIESGTGSMYMKDSTIDKQNFESGTGKIHQEGKYNSPM